MGVRVLTKAPPLMAGNAIEHALARISHAALYGLVVLMPVTGATMGFMGDKGLPFFFTTFAPASAEPRRQTYQRGLQNTRRSTSCMTGVLSRMILFEASRIVPSPLWYDKEGHHDCASIAGGEVGVAQNGKLAGKAYWLHTRAGQVLEYMIPMHVGAVGVHHVFKGQNILARVNPFVR